MKKALIMVVAMAMILSLSACNGESASNNSDAPPAVSQSLNKKGDQTPLEELEETILNDVDCAISDIRMECEKVVSKIDTYNKYLENTTTIESLYAKILENTENLCIKMREYSVDYARAILTSDKSNDDKYDDFDDLYDCIYDDAGDEIYDGIYDEIFEDLYDAFYDGILDDAYDEMPYKEWSKIHSNEYDWWSDARSDVYDAWSDFRSDVYEFWSDMGSCLWDNDLEKAEKTLNNFQDDIDKLMSNATQDDSGNSEQTEKKTSEDIRPEFKEAMDSYEAFADEYVLFMKKYTTSNGDDPTLLADYATYMSKYSDMMADFESWDSEDMNTAETAYYIEIQSRISQKLLNVAE